MRYRSLGSTGLRVSEIGFGAWAIGGNGHGNSYGPTDDAESKRAIAAALDAGCTFFDTADCYGHGHSEELLGEVLGPRRHGVVLATKGGSDFYHDPPRLNFTAPHLSFAAEESLKRLRTDYLDLYLLHNPPFSVIQAGHLFEALEDLRKAGKIRHYGISIHDPQEGLLAMKQAPLAAIQAAFNYLRREAAEELFPRVIEENVALIAREPLANGFLAGRYSKDSIFPVGDIRHQWPSKYQTQLIHQVDDFMKSMPGPPFTPAQAALRFVLAQPAVSTVIVGCKTALQVEENFKASELTLSLAS